MKKETKNKILINLMILPLLATPLNTLAYTKDETVYSSLKYNGEVKETKVNNHLSKLEGKSIEDETLLKEIINLNGNEDYKKEDNKLIWNYNGKDIFYQGKTKEDLPVSVNIEYYLNDKLSSPKKMLKKKGDITIKISLKNNSYNKEKGLHTPFVLTTGILLDSTNNRDIEISNGEVVETGTRSMAVAIAAPGLYDDLKIAELKSLDEIKITYKTDSFSLNNIYIVATPKLLEKLDIEKLNKINLLDSSIKTISSNMDKIEEGTKSLTDGAIKLNTGSSELTSSIETLKSALKKLEVGGYTLNDGLKETVKSLENAKVMLESKNISQSLSNINTLISTNQNTIDMLNSTNNTLRPNYENYSLGNFKTDEELINYFSSINIDSNTISNLLTCKKTYEANQNISKLLMANNETLKVLTSSFKEITDSLDSLLVKLTTALQELENGSYELSTGLTEVNSGVDKMYNGSKTLTNATQSLTTGATTLKDGVTTLNEEGIKKLNSYSDTLVNKTHQLKELSKLSNEYKGYSSPNSNKTVFIYKVESLKK